MDFQKFLKAMTTDASYNEAAKGEFRREAMKMARAVGEALGYAKADYDVRWNKSGDACSGDVILHSDELYIHFTQNGAGMSDQFMWRVCRSRKESQGGANQWMRWTELADLEAVAAKMLRYAKMGRHPVKT